MGLFRKTAREEPLAVTMAAVKLGNRFLAVGVRDPALIAVLAAKAGLTGTACAVDADETAVTQAAASIEAAGVLADVTRAPWGRWPYADGSFDVAVIRNLLPSLTPDDRRHCVAEVLRVLRPGGRALVIDGSERGAFARLTGGSRTAPSYDPVGTFKAAGFGAVRELANLDGVVYVEGIKKTG
jgi:ubiquinone/menaquinone biosynthesis C-methylase UbiE